VFRKRKEKNKREEEVRWEQNEKEGNFFAANGCRFYKFNGIN
jgi:hypothetical protein